MVVIPVKLYPSTHNKDISFVNLHSTGNTRSRRAHYCPTHERTVDSSEIVRAYEYAKDQYVIMEDSDFVDLPVPSKRVIEITQIADLSSIGPMYVESSYSLKIRPISPFPGDGLSKGG